MSSTEPKWITLQEWASKKFATVPHRNTLHRWAENGSIVPSPWKAGRDWYVHPDARHVNEPNPEKRLVGRVLSRGLPTT